MRVFFLEFRELAFIAQVFIIRVRAGQIAIHASSAAFIASLSIAIRAALGVPLLELNSQGLICANALSVVKQALRGEILDLIVF